MELRQFRQFIAVAEELSFRKAAERLNMAQPPLTAAIRKLEEELGVLLIVRSNKVDRLTDVGELFLQEARRTVLQAQHAVALARETGRGLRGVLRVTYLASAMSSVMPPILKDFRERYPAAVLDLEEQATDQQISGLAEGHIDVGFIALPVQDRRGLTHEIVLDDEFMVVLPPDHPLSHMDHVDISALAQDNWIMFPRRHGPGLHERLIMACAAAGFVPNVVLEAFGTESIINLVGSGMGVALVPKTQCRWSRWNVSFHPLRGPGTPIRYQLALAYGVASPLRDAFLLVTRRYLGAASS